jgi:hypothetical protein
VSRPSGTKSDENMAVSHPRLPDFDEMAKNNLCMSGRCVADVTNAITMKSVSVPRHMSMHMGS